MLCREVMTKKVIWVASTDSAGVAARVMRDADVGFLAVCDFDTSSVIGVITDRDIAIRLVADDRPASTPVTDVMTRGFLSCKPDEDVVTAERLMGKHQKARILCIDGDQNLVGVISLADLTRREEVARVTETLTREGNGSSSM